MQKYFYCFLPQHGRRAHTILAKEPFPLDVLWLYLVLLVREPWVLVVPLLT